MKKQQKSILVLAIVTAFVATALVLPGLIGAGDLEPPGPPGPTMKTLNQIPPTWSQILPATERFELVMGGEAVLDKETGLTWAKDANLFGLKTWLDAIFACADLTLGNRKGWRMPTREELASLLDMSQSGSPKLPSGHPFINVQSKYYWTGNKSITDMAWFVDFGEGKVFDTFPNFYCYVWPVRGGNWSPITN